MRKGTTIFAAAALAAGLMACAPKAEETQPAVSIEETQETVRENGNEIPDSEDASAGSKDETPNKENGPEEMVQISDELLEKIYTAVKAAYGETYIPSMMFDETMLEGMFGITEDQYDSYVAEGPMISAHVETFIGVKAREGQAAHVAEKLEEYRERQLEESIQYPMNMPKLEASQIITHGNYVFFVMLGSPDREAEEQGEDAALESAKKNNQIAVDTIAGFFES